MTRLLTGAAVCLLLAQPLAAGERLTLRDAIAEAFAANPQHAEAVARADAAQGAKDEARAAWLPVIGVSQSVTRGDNPVFVFGSLLEQGRFGAANFDPAFLNAPPSLTNYRIALDARVAVFDQFRRLEANRIATRNETSARSMLEDARQRLRAETVSRFWAVALADAARDVADSAVATAESEVAAMQQRFDQGLLVESDLRAAQVQLASHRRAQIESAGRAASARAALNVLLGRPVLAEVELAGDVPSPKELAIDLPQAIESAQRQRGAAMQANNAAANAAANLSSAKGALLPRIDAFASWGASGRSFDDRNSDHTFGAVVSLPLFDAARYARMRQSRAAVAAADAERRAALDRIALEVIDAWNRRTSARASVDVAAAAVAQAEAADRIVRDRYEQGLTTITELLRAQTALVRARLDVLEARHELVVSHAELLRATGGLNDVEDF